MMRFFRRHKIDFYELLLNQSKKVEAGMHAFVEYMKDPHAFKGQIVLRSEEEADVLRKNIIIELNQAFITPIDREDIYNLSRAVDDIIDYAQSTVVEMMAFGVTPNKHMLLMSEAVYNAASQIVKAIEYLPIDQNKSTECLVSAKKKENYVEHCYREALVELFKEENVVSILKVREVYRHLSNAADRGDEAANIIGNILMKSM